MGEHRIAVLPPEEARKIAAGEVVDRPAALVREFLDNAIDAGGKQIEVFIDEGGCRRVEVDDDGEGMDRENLELCTLTHATSKIRSLDDLATTETLGFRGEALAAAAAVASLEIVSSTDGQEGRSAWKLLAGPGESHPPRIEAGSRNQGTSIRALGLFDTIPARKRFLKREGSEALLCRQTFIDKALAFPEIDLRFTQDNTLKLSFPKVKSLKERFGAILLNSSAANLHNEKNFLHELYAIGEGFRITIVVGGPEIYRNDRRQQFIFANRRRIQDFSLIQALEYGVQGWFPNGLHPVGAVYLDIDPALADFNIHPAKREARFTDPGAIHHAITSALRDFTRASRAGGPTPVEKDPAQEFNGFETSQQSYAGPAASRGDSNRLALEALLDHPPDFALRPGRSDTAESVLSAHSNTTGWAVAEASPPYGKMATENPRIANQSNAPVQLRFIGRAFDLFLLVEQGGKLFIIDQHAAHERILYNRFLSKPITKQELLVPIPFDTESPEEDRFLAAKREELERLGIVIEETEGGQWQIIALPEGWRLSDGETRDSLRELRNAGENMAERWAATLSCHRAVRDGDYLDDQTAAALAETALALPDPHCPHGRPVWVEISREQLYKGVKRT